MCGPGEGAGDFNPNVFLSGHTLKLFIVKLITEDRRALFCG